MSLKIIRIAAISAALASAVAIAGRPAVSSAEDAQSEKTAQAASKTDGDTLEGPQLWSANCGRCHNRRSPEKFSDAQWDVIVRHMRVRANLTGEEERKILDFLKSAN